MNGQDVTTKSRDTVIRSRGDSLLDQIDVALYAVDAAGLCVRMNVPAQRLLGYTQDEALGRDMHALVHSRYPDGSIYPVEACPLLRARSLRYPLRGLEEVMWHKSGVPLPVECSASPALMEDGSVGAVVTLKDLRDQKDAKARQKAAEVEQVETLRQRDAMARVEREAAAAEVERQREVQNEVERVATAQLREQQELLGRVAETAPVGIAVLDAEARYRWTNASYQRSMDPAYREMRLPGMSLFDVVAPGNLEEMRAIVRGVQETGRAFSAEAYPLEGVARGRTYWRWSLSRLENGDLMSTGLDVTEAVRARGEVEAVYANAPTALSLIDARTMRYLRVNLQYAEMMGVPRESMLGSPAGSYTEGDGGWVLQQALAGETVRNEFRQLKILSDPTVERYFLLNATPNRDAQGEVETISLAIVEVTAQKRAENALVQADKLAAVGRLAASISHEINNPLEAVTNLLYLVHQDPALSEESGEYVKMAESELARVSQIASQTLRFHRHAVRPVELTPEQVVSPVMALYQGRLKNSQVTVDVEHRGEGTRMVVHEGDVRQILNNLVGNAIDAMPQGGKVKIRTRPARCVHTRRRGTRISVTDSGVGMSAETAAHIFEPFFTTKGSSGSGLGLWISHTLARRHGGELRVRSRRAADSRTGRSGTVFTLFLPDMDVQQET